jgi:hypothetical protein
MRLWRKLQPDKIMEREFQATLKAAWSLDDFSLSKVAKYVYDKICFVRARRRDEGAAAEFDALVAVARLAVQHRHETVSLGARSRSDPTWAAASLTESWATAKVGAAQQKLSPALAEKIERELKTLIDRALSEAEKLEREQVWEISTTDDHDDGLR